MSLQLEQGVIVGIQLEQGVTVGHHLEQGVTVCLQLEQGVTVGRLIATISAIWSRSLCDSSSCSPVMEI